MSSEEKGGKVLRHVYLIAANEAGPCKIGVAGKPDARLRDLQTGNAQKLALHGSFPCEDAEALERAVHARLAPANMTGEWFGVPVKVAWQALCYEFAAMGAVAPLPPADEAIAEGRRADPIRHKGGRGKKGDRTPAQRQAAYRARKSAAK